MKKTFLPHSKTALEMSPFFDQKLTYLLNFFNLKSYKFMQNMEVKLNMNGSTSGSDITNSSYTAV